jgi:hypothetical protein
VEIQPVFSSNEPRVGLFWFIAKDRRPSRFASISRPFSHVAEVAGFKTLDEGHVDVWPMVQRFDETLADYDYDYFPRGRVNSSAAVSLLYPATSAARIAASFLVSAMAVPLPQRRVARLIARETAGSV